jgi:transcription initiation factor IIE alpha subunit
MMQADLFAAPAFTDPPEPRKLARRGAPSTSKLAALEVPNFAGEHHAVILQALKDHGARGLTVHEIAAYCRLDAHAIGKRMNELRAGNIVEVMRERDRSMILCDVTRKTPSGRQARVWVLKKGAA